LKTGDVRRNSRRPDSGGFGLFVRQRHRSTAESIPCSDCGNRCTVPLPIPDLTDAFTYRIVIGQSHHQTDNERHAIQRHRRDDLRIRSFDWLIEKPTHY
jgi:hypothetical protein